MLKPTVNYGIKEVEKNLFRQNGGPLQIGSPDFKSQTNASKIGCVGGEGGEDRVCQGIKETGFGHLRNKQNTSFTRGKLV